MLIKPNLIANSEQRFKQADFSPTELDRKLGDGPIQMSVQKKQLRQRQLLEQTDDPQLVQIGLERIIQGNDLDSINYLARGTQASHSICRIQLKDARANLIGYATGFLIGPGLLMTNHHVFGKLADATNSIADFDFELDMAGLERTPVRLAFSPRDFSTPMTGWITRSWRSRRGRYPGDASSPSGAGCRSAASPARAIPANISPSSSIPAARPSRSACARTSCSNMPAISCGT